MYKDGKKWCFAAIATVTFGAGIVYNTNSAHADTNDNATITASASTASASTASATTNASGASSTSSASSILKSVTSTDSQISNVSVSVTTEDGTVMNGGDSYTIASGQSVNLSSINISFTLTQDGTLTSGSVVKIPVSVTNNSDELVSSALSSGTSIDIENVGTIYYEDGYYVLTIGDDFDQTVGKQVSVTVTEKPASTSKITATDSYNNMVLTIGNETFTFIPQHRTYTEDTGDYSSSDFSYSPSANTINTGTTMTDPNYINNIISSNGSDAGETGIPTGNIISIQHISTSGSSVVSIKLGTYFGSSTLQINEDGTYLITGDNSESFSLGDNTGIINIITMSADSTDAEIIAALNAAGKGSGVIIENSDGSYTLAYNFGVITSDDNKTYGEVFGDSADAGISTSSDASQEINRTDDVNAKLNELLSSAYIIQDLGVQNNVVFSDGSVINYLTGTGTEYNVDSSGTATVISSSNFSSSTTPSNSRAEGQSKITVHYVDENGTELQSEDYAYGYPAGSDIAEQSPDYAAAPATIPGYTLVTTEYPISSINGTQLTSGSNIEFLESDQDVYYVYAPNKESATVTYIDDTTGEVLSTANLSGNYGTTDSYRTADTIQNYESEGYSLVSDDYPSDGVVYDEDGTVKSYVVHLTHSTSETTENKSVNETIHYVYSDGSEAYSDYTATPVEFTRTVTTDNVTGEKVYGDWTAVDGSSFSSVTSPTITGYTPDKGQVDGVNNVTADTADIVDTVTYTANKETANVTYIDDTTGEVLSTANLSGDYGTTDSYRTADTIQNYESEGYSLVSDDYPSDGVVYDEDGTVKSYEVHLVHKTVPIGPDNPETPGQPIHPDDPDGPTWPAGTDKASLTKTITRTINYLDKSTGKVVSKQVTQTVTYNRTAIVDEVTGALLGYDTNGDGNVDTTNEDAAWVAANGDQWSLVTSPDLSDDGYGSPSLAQVDSVTVTADTADSVVNVYYDTPSTPSTSGTSGTPSTPLVNTSTTVTNGGINGKLPQTGDEKNTNLSIMGVILLALSSVLALFGLGKRRETK